MSPRSLRYYEQQGLLTSVRAPSGQRHYSEAEVERVGFLRRLFAAGLSSRVIATVLPCVDSPTDGGKVDDAFSTMVREHERIADTIDQLIDVRDVLHEMICDIAAHRASLSGADSAA